MAKKDINIHLRNERLVNLMRNFCKTNNLTYVEFVVKLLDSFFEKRQAQLSMKTREELIDMIMKYEERNKK